MICDVRDLVGCSNGPVDLRDVPQIKLHRPRKTSKWFVQPTSPSSRDTTSVIAISHRTHWLEPTSGWSLLFSSPTLVTDAPVKIEVEGICKEPDAGGTPTTIDSERGLL